MKILVFGHKGWIGQQVLDYLKFSCHDIILSNSRVDNKEDVEEEIKLYTPTHIFCFIGRTHGKIDDTEFSTIDYLEQPGKIVENVRDNLFSPIVLAILCEKYNIHLTYLGTGCIFEFDEEHPFGLEENGFTDQLMHMFKNTLNVRIRMPITGETNPRNFITKITKYKKICSIPNSMTVLPELIPVMVDMANKNLTGTINLTNPGLISHNEILQMYKEHVDPNFTWENFNILEQNQILASKRSNNYLDTAKLQELYPHIKNIKDSVKDILIHYKL